MILLFFYQTWNKNGLSISCDSHRKWCWYGVLIVPIGMIKACYSVGSGMFLQTIMGSFRLIMACYWDDHVVRILMAYFSYDYGRFSWWLMHFLVMDLLFLCFYDVFVCFTILMFYVFIFDLRGLSLRGNLRGVIFGLNSFWTTPGLLVKLRMLRGLLF